MPIGASSKVRLSPLNTNATFSAKPQEPYTWKSVAEATRNVMKTRYRLLPYWETLFAEAKLKGT
jgi:alpha-glucosidase (family GH31 glycosyl hydrolase)